MKYGYKWVANKLCDVFIVKLQILNEFVVYDLPDEYKCYEDLYTTKCIVEDIYRLRDRKQFFRISNGAYFPFEYSIGKKIHGNTIFFCRSEEELLKNQSKGISMRIEQNKQIMKLIDAYNTSKDKHMLQELKTLMQQSKLDRVASIHWHAIKHHNY